MLAMSRYPQEYVERCRARMAADVAAYDAVAAAAGEASERFEPAFFNNLLLALDHWFTHRGRGLEGKDGNTLNEVRVLSDSLTEYDGVVTLDKTIRLRPESSVLGLAAGDPIALTRADFERLSAAFLREIEQRYR